MYICQLAFPGLWSLLFFYQYHWDFPECFLKGELVVVLAQLVWDIVEAWHSHCIWACFSPWPLKTFSQRTGSVGLIRGYSQRTRWLEMGALLWPWCCKILPWCVKWNCWDGFSTLRGGWGEPEFLTTGLKHRKHLNLLVNRWIPSAGGNAAPSKGGQVSFLWWPYPFETFPESLIIS